MMSGRAITPHVVTEFVLRLSDAWTNRVADAVEALTAAGASVTRVAEDHRVLAGVIESTRIDGLWRLPCVEDFIEGATYIVDGREPVAGDSAGAVRHRDPRAAIRKSANQTNGGPRDASRSSLRTPRHAPAFHRFPDLFDLGSGDDPLPQDRVYDVEQMGRTWGRTAPVRFESIDYRPSECEAALVSTRPRLSRGAICLAYLSIAALAVYLLVDAAGRAPESRPIVPTVYACACAALFSVAIVAACGLWRYRPLRHACTAFGLLMGVLPCLVWDEASLVRAVVGLAAFLLAGATADLISKAK